jgi:hypothetical protein
MTVHANYSLNNTTPVRLTSPGTHSGLSITIQNISDEDNVYIGGENVTTSSFGASLSPAAGISVDLANGYDSLYAIGDTSDARIAVLIVSLA